MSTTVHGLQLLWKSFNRNVHFYYTLFSTEIENFDKRAKFLLAKSIEEFFFCYYVTLN